MTVLGQSASLELTIIPNGGRSETQRTLDISGRNYFKLLKLAIPLNMKIQDHYKEPLHTRKTEACGFLLLVLT